MDCRLLLSFTRRFMYLPKDIFCFYFISIFFPLFHNQIKPDPYWICQHIFFKISAPVLAKPTRNWQAAPQCNVYQQEIHYKKSTFTHRNFCRNTFYYSQTFSNYFLQEYKPTFSRLLREAWNYCSEGYCKHTRFPKSNNLGNFHLSVTLNHPIYVQSPNCSSSTTMKGANPRSFHRY